MKIKFDLSEHDICERIAETFRGTFPSVTADTVRLKGKRAVVEAVTNELEPEAEAPAAAPEMGAGVGFDVGAH